MQTDREYLRLALQLARRGYGQTSPNPMVGAVLVKGGRLIGRGWHHRAGAPHAEIEALRDAKKRGFDPKGAVLYVTLEPCCTHGRTPPCTQAILAAGIARVVVGATDPNPQHCGAAYRLLKRAGIAVTSDVLAEDCTRLNEAFNHWIVHRTPFVTVKAAMTLDGKIATASGESKWITGEQARAYGMKLRQGADAILVGINTVLADDPSLTVRAVQSLKSKVQSPKPEPQAHRLRRLVLDTRARTPLGAKVVSDADASLTTIVVGESAPRKRIMALAKQVRVLVVPEVRQKATSSHAARSSKALSPGLDLNWLLKALGSENVTNLLVEGGGEANASFLRQGLAQRVAFFYAPLILGGRDSRPAVGGEGATALSEALKLTQVEWRKLGQDWLLTGRVGWKEPV